LLGTDARALPPADEHRRGGRPAVHRLGLAHRRDAGRLREHGRLAAAADRHGLARAPGLSARRHVAPAGGRLDDGPGQRRRGALLLGLGLGAPAGTAVDLLLEVLLREPAGLLLADRVRAARRLYA